MALRTCDSCLFINFHEKRQESDLIMTKLSSSEPANAENSCEQILPAGWLRTDKTWFVQSSWRKRRRRVDGWRGRREMIHSIWQTLRIWDNKLNFNLDTFSVLLKIRRKSSQYSCYNQTVLLSYYSLNWTGYYLYQAYIGLKSRQMVVSKISPSINLGFDGVKSSNW